MVQAEPHQENGSIGVHVEGPNEQSPEDAVVLNTLSYAYSGHHPIVSNISLSLPKGSRCLLLGANGAGKSTLLQILAGQYMVGPEAVRILGRPAFHDIQLTSSGQLSYLGQQWRRDIAFAGYNVPIQGDIAAGKMIFGVEGVDPQRRQQLIDLLEVDLEWRLNKVSDGQRRRVQICMGLLKPYQVLLLDEITVDMDVVGRLDLLKFFVEECETRGATIIYATHIFDGLEKWITHIAYLMDGHLRIGAPANEVPALHEGKKLLRVVEKWLRSDLETSRKEEAADPSLRAKRPGAPIPRTTPLMPTKHMMFYRG